MLSSEGTMEELRNDPSGSLSTKLLYIYCFKIKVVALKLLRY